MRQAVFILLVLLTSSCSLVFEDRSDCPCLLTIDYRPCNGSAVDRLESIMIDGNEILFKESIAAPFLEKKNPVKKGSYYFSSWGNCIVNGEGTGIYPDDRNEPYSFYTGTDCQKDTCRISVLLRPEFAVVSVRIIDLDGDEVEAVLTGCNSGFTGRRGILSEKAVYGLELSRCSGELRGKRNLLRMKDVRTLGIRLSRGDKCFDYPVGRILAENGYDMGKDVLDPIDITIDSTESEISIKTLDWEYVDSTEISF